MAGRVYDTARWRKKVRPAALQRANYRCEVPLPATGERCGQPARSVDHIIPLSEDGAPYDPSNLRAACTSCNTRLRNARRAALARAALGEPATTPRARTTPRRPSAKETRQRMTRKGKRNPALDPSQPLDEGPATELRW